MDAKDLQDWLTRWLADRLEVREAEIDPDQPMAGLGLRSLDVVELSGELEELLDRPLSPTTVYGEPTVVSLARRLASEGPQPQEQASPAPYPPAPHEPVAVLGMGLRFPPDVSTPEEFWQLLHQGGDAVRPVPDNRLADLPQTSTAHSGLTARGGYLQHDLAAFDADFFGLSGREANATDPQQRLMLETAWEALEHSGIPPRSLCGSRTGVFVGASASDYGTLQLSDLDAVDAWSGTGSALSVLANRVSYTLGLRGPSLTVDTACSSSLTALHQAIRSLRLGECDLALVGGSNLLLSPAITVNFEEAGVMAADARCKTFSADADGYGRGEGVGTVVLKRLSDAERDGDPVLALLRGSAVNQDGASNGLMAPNPDAQEQLLRAALADAGLRGADIDYIEAHGTGTALGDPIEATAIAEALLKGPPRAEDLLLGSVKTNIGHLEAAAGIAGLVKVVLSLTHERLPAHLNFTSPNPLIPFAEHPMSVVATPRPWPRGSRVRRAGVSSFGFGGANAHVVVEEASPAAALPATEDPAPSGPLLVPLSAGSPSALRSHARRVAESIRSRTEGPPLAAVARTLARHRSHERARLALVVRTSEELVDGLSAYAAEEAPPVPLSQSDAGSRRPSEDGPVWVFSGQGSQWDGMGSELLAAGAEFHRVVDTLDPLLAAASDGECRLRELLEAAEPPTDIGLLQPLLFAVQLGIAALWQERGVQPAAVIGHSMGEVAAAVVAGALSMEDGAKVICRRSRLLRRIAGAGAMASVALPAEELRRRLAELGFEDRVDIAVMAGPHTTVLSGAAEAVRSLTEKYQAEDIDARLIRVDVASHSPQVDVLLPELRECLADLTPRAPELPFFSTVDRPGGRDSTFDAAYWADNLRLPVRLSQAVRAAAEARHSWFIEISPHPVLVRDVGSTLRAADVPHALVQPSVLRGQDPAVTLLATLGAAHCDGRPLAWDRLHPRGGLVDLPRQAWERRRYWTSARPPVSSPPASADTGTADALPGPGIEVAGLPGTRLWQLDLAGASFAPAREHRIRGTALLPLSGYLRLGLAAGAEVGMTTPTLRDLTVHAPLPLDQAPDTLQLLLSPGTAGTQQAELTFHSRVRGETAWTHVASARLHDRPTELTPTQAPPRPAAGVVPTDVERHYADLAAAGLQYGPGLRTLDALWPVAPASVLARAEDVDLPAHGGPGTPRELADQKALRLLDAPFQALPACLAGTAAQTSAGFAVTGVDSVSMSPDPGRQGPVWVRAQTRPNGSGYLAELKWYRGEELAGSARGVRIEPLAAGGEQLPAHWLRRVVWQPQEVPGGTGEPAGPVLIVADSRGFGDTLALLLRAREIDCTVLPAEGPGPDSKTLRSARHLLYCGGLDVGVTADPKAATDLTVQAVRWVQRVAGCGTDGPRLWFVTSGAQTHDEEHPGEGPDVSPAQAVLWGIGRSAALEHPAHWGGLVDLDAPYDPARQEASARALVAEVGAWGTGVESAHRSGRRWVPRLLPAHAVPAASPDLSDDGCRLVVGATGRLGPGLLRRLAHLGARHLVVLTRRGLHGEAAEAAEELTRRGSVVTDIVGDVSDESVLRELFSRFGADLPELRGVYHAAFAEDVTTLTDLTPERLTGTLRAKVAGTALLHRLTRSHPKADFVCYSSTTALLGSQGLAHYAAGGCFQDALVHHRRREGLPGSTLNWGPWADGLEDPAARALIEGSGMRLMPGSTAVLALDRVHGGADSPLVVADADWPALAEVYATRMPVPMLAGLEAPAPALPTASGSRRAPDPYADDRKRDARVPASAPPRRTLTVESVEHEVRVLAAQLLSLPGPDALHAHSNLYAQGLDSLMTMTMLRRLRAFAPTLTPRVFQEHPTPAELAAAVLRTAEQRPDPTEDTTGTGVSP